MKKWACWHRKRSPPRVAWPPLVGVGFTSCNLSRLNTIPVFALLYNLCKIIKNCCKLIYSAWSAICCRCDSIHEVDSTGQLPLAFWLMHLKLCPFRLVHILDRQAVRKLTVQRTAQLLICPWFLWLVCQRSTDPEARQRYDVLDWDENKNTRPNFCVWLSALYFPVSKGRHKLDRFSKRRHGN